MPKLNRRKFILLSTAAVAGFAVGSSASNGAAMKREFTVESTTELKQTGFPPGVSRIDYASSVDGLKDWALVMPPKSGNTWIVHIHGHGSTGDQIYTRPDIRDTFLSAYLKQGLGVLSPNLRGNAWMSPTAASDMHDLVNHVRSKYNADKFIFISGSMGGTSNLAYAVLYPQDVAAVIALCPATDIASYYNWCRKHNTAVRKEIADAIETAYGTTPDRNPRLFAKHSAVKNAAKLTMPVFISHGTMDDVIPVSQPRELVSKMGESANFCYVEIPDGGHDSPLVPGFIQGSAWVMSRLSSTK